MSKNGSDLLGMLGEAGVDVAGAKSALASLDEKFGGETGDIPDGALYAWVDQFFDNTKARKLFFLLGKTMEKELVSSLPEDRKWERGPKAQEIKQKKNLEKQGKK